MAPDSTRDTPQMSETRFWEIIALLDWEKTGDDEAVLLPAKRALMASSEDDICIFNDILSEKLYALDTREHARYTYLGEADPDNGDEYISADDFLYRRCVVVANGQQVFDAVLADPQQMPQGLEFESLLHLAVSAFEEKTGREFDHPSPLSYESFSNDAGWAPTPQTRPGTYTDASVPPLNRRPT